VRALLERERGREGGREGEGERERERESEREREREGGREGERESFTVTTVLINMVLLIGEQKHAIHYKAELGQHVFQIVPSLLIVLLIVKSTRYNLLTIWQGFFNGTSPMYLFIVLFFSPGRASSS
jgi:hypothetical protein